MYKKKKRTKNKMLDFFLYEGALFLHINYRPGVFAVDE